MSGTLRVDKGTLCAGNIISRLSRYTAGFPALGPGSQKRHFRAPQPPSSDTPVDVHVIQKFKIFLNLVNLWKQVETRMLYCS